MKRIFILVAIALFAAGSLFADEAILIDFSKLVADIIPNQDDAPTQNRATMMDYANVAGGSFTTEQKSVMKTSLAIPNWEVVLASSSRTVDNQIRSYTVEAPSKQFGTVMGVRVHFPVEPFHSWAIIKPPFDIPAFEASAEIDDEGNIQEPESGEFTNTGSTRFEDGFGVIKNVGTIKSVAVNAYGLNFPHSLAVILVDSQGNEQYVNMGYLNYDGWGELRWDNPSYVVHVRNRELRLYPLYPKSTPFIKFGGFLVQRDAANEGGDFITYFKDVKVIYDKAVLETDRDIDDESLWNIIRDRENAKKAWEMSRFGQNQVLRYLESQKQATENSFTPTATTNEQQ
ncbi:flagellar filament outer layer protein FlaA [Breznakiella homolactica]|uniref:Flagellar filament outer layer protein FlaA n=1 Tax=Breznakiella homolactica TaxID=2798577 RepID=A0A7T8B9K5_9SPIR|nr:flagellar filament outer layer protein FlaA [Breznakiella homolactica]QQO08406.1 flagellar filament outer layer protein FlaA [Breznakiella homolactica]